MTKKYRILFRGAFQDKDHFMARMHHFGMPTDAVERILSSAPVVLKGNLSLGDARRFAEDIQEAGGRVTIQEDGILEDRRRLAQPLAIVGLSGFTLCPECGLKQRKGAACERCGTSLVRP